MINTLRVPRRMPSINRALGGTWPSTDWAMDCSWAAACQRARTAGAQDTHLTCGVKHCCARAKQELGDLEGREGGAPVPRCASTRDS
jgi:hypothetical protein